MKDPPRVHCHPEPKAKDPQKRYALLLKHGAFGAVYLGMILSSSADPSLRVSRFTQDDNARSADPSLRASRFTQDDNARSADPSPSVQDDRLHCATSRVIK